VTDGSGGVEAVERARAARRPPRLAIALVAVVLTALSVWVLTGRSTRDAAVPAGVSPSRQEQAIAFSVAAVDGTVVSSPSGKPEVLLFLTSQGCSSCQAQAETLDQLARRAGGQATLLGIEMDPSVRTRDLIKFGNDLGGLHYPLASDSDGSLQRRFGANALGTVVILDAAGHGVYRAVDPTLEDMWSGLQRVGVV
jgi:peroxiredoxin